MEDPMSAPARPLRRKLSPLALFEALATPHGIDRYLELVHPMLTVRDLRASVTAVRRSAEGSVTLTLRPTRQWQGFQAGQFVQLSVDIDGVRRTRSYSPACSQYRDDGHIELTIKAHPQGVVSQYLHAAAEPGLVVGLSQADGEFRLPQPRPDKVLLISGGSGITPVMSMLRTLCDEGFAGDLTFLHYGRSARAVPYRDELRALDAAHDNVRLVLAHTDEGDLPGRFGQDHLDVAAPWYADGETFVCGPPGLMDSVQALYRDQDLSDRLHFENFVPTSILADDDATGAVSFGRSGLSVDNDGTTLLEQAEAAGLTPDYGCRMGICFTCTTVKTAGCTRNIRTGDTHVNPDAEIQLCISVPVGDVALDL
jgi:stearoyl-CoA 9-desaturase NADPH oxidoreductase